MEYYANDHFETYAKDTNLRDQVLLKNPVQENLQCQENSVFCPRSVKGKKQTKRHKSQCYPREFAK